MISKLAEKAAENMIAFGEIESGEKELYIYGFFMLFSRLLYLIMTAAVGILLGVFIESMVFFAAFFTIRGYAGGIHAASEAACTMLTSIALTLSILFIKVCSACSALYMPMGFLALSAVAVLWLSPIDTPGKRLTLPEKRSYKKKTAITLALIFAVATLAIRGKLFGLLSACAVSVTLEALLLICAKLHTDIS